MASIKTDEPKTAEPITNIVDGIVAARNRGFERGVAGKVQGKCGAEIVGDQGRLHERVQRSEGIGWRWNAETRKRKNVKRRDRRLGKGKQWGWRRSMSRAGKNTGERGRRSDGRAERQEAGDGKRSDRGSRVRSGCNRRREREGVGWWVRTAERNWVERVEGAWRYRSNEGRKRRRRGWRC